MDEILSFNDVEIFLKQLIDEGTNVHPDEDFNNYINLNTGLTVYTKEEAFLRNTLMNQCFVICQAEGIDLYEIANKIYAPIIGTGY